MAAARPAAGVWRRLDAADIAAAICLGDAPETAVERMRSAARAPSAISRPVAAIAAYHANSTAIAGGARGFKDSTRGLFANVDAIGGEFPDALKDAIREADRFARLPFLRDEPTHASQQRSLIERLKPARILPVMHRLAVLTLDRVIARRSQSPR